MINVTGYGFEVAGRAPAVEGKTSGEIAVEAFDAFYAKVQAAADKHAAVDETIKSFGLSRKLDSPSMNLELCGTRLHIFVSTGSAKHVRVSKSESVNEIDANVKILIVGGLFKVIDVERGADPRAIVSQLAEVVKDSLKPDTDDRLAEIASEITKMQAEARALTALTKDIYA